MREPIASILTRIRGLLDGGLSASGLRAALHQEGWSRVNVNRALVIHFSRSEGTP